MNSIKYGYAINSGNETHRGALRRIGARGRSDMSEEEHDRQVIPLVEETVRVDKRETVSGKVRVRTEIDSVEQVVKEALTEESVEVTRVPINQRIEQVPDVRTENGVMIVPVLEERLVIEKQLFLKEELHIRRDVKTETVEVPITLRSERAVVERFDANGQPLPEESTS
jgi:uncharacterized protein (TIGR02271 family)